MKNLLFVSVALSVFTVTETSAQSRFNSVSIIGPTEEFYSPAEARPAATSKYASMRSIFSPARAIATEICSSLQFKYAQILNREVETLSHFSLFSFIDEWWGTKYRFGGTTKKGIDCSAFTSLLMGQVFGFDLPRTARAQYALCAKMAEEELLEGDLVFFNTRGGVSHVGVFLGDGYFAHSSCGAGVTISNLNESYYRRKFIGGGRITAPDFSVKNS